MLRSIILAAALASGAFAAAPALADTARPAVAKVAYGDLDLGSAQGARALEARLDHALKRVCDYNPHERAQALRQASQRCIAQTRAQIVLPQPLAARIAAR